MLSSKVREYINRREFQQEKNPDWSCYLHTTKLEETLFTEDKQKELFDYFFERRKEKDIPSFSFWVKPTLAEVPVFSDIQDYIIEVLENEIKNLEENLSNSENLLNYLDYLNCLSTVFLKEKVTEYLQKIYKKLNKTNKLKNEESTVNIKSIIELLMLIVNNSHISMSNILINELLYLKSLAPNESKYVSESFACLLLGQEKITTDLFPFVEYVLANDTSIMKFFYIHAIITKTDDVQFLGKLMNNNFPRDIKNMHGIFIEDVHILFILINRLHKLKESSTNILNLINDQNNRNFLLKYVGYLYQRNNIKIEIKIGLYKEKVSFDYFLGNTREYIEELSRTPNFTWLEVNLWARTLFKELITTPKKFEACSTEAQLYYSQLVENESDPLWDKISAERKKSILLNNKVYEKEERIKEQRENAITDCIKIFFDRKELSNDIGTFFKYFNKEIIEGEELYSYHHHFWSENKEDFINQEQIILNPFLFNYVCTIYQCLTEEKINLRLVFTMLESGWRKYWGLHLYNYMIEIKEKEFTFTESQVSDIENYFQNLQLDNIENIAYIYWHLSDIFDFSLKTLPEKVVLGIMKTTYQYLQKDNPMQVLICKKATEIIHEGLLSPNISGEQIDFLPFFKKHSIDKIDIIDKLIETLEIEQTYEYKIVNSNYYQLLSIINIYNTLETQEAYKEKVYKLLLGYIDVTLKKSGKIFIFSQLVLENFAKESLLTEVVEKIYKYPQIQDCHMRFIDKLQDDIFYKKNIYLEKNILLEQIYKIRMQIRNGKKQVVLSEFLKNDPYDEKQPEKSNIVKLNILAEKIIKNIDSKRKTSSADAFEFSNLLDTVKTNFDNIIEEQNTTYLEKDNIINSLYFLDKDISLWVDFLKKSKTFQNGISQWKCQRILSEVIINKNINMNIFTKALAEAYAELPSKIEYPKIQWHTVDFELRNVLDDCIDSIIDSDTFYEDASYDNLIQCEEIEIHKRKRLVYKKRTRLYPIRIRILDNKKDYKIKYDGEEENNQTYGFSEIKKYIMKKFKGSSNFVSQIKNFDYIFSEVKNRNMVFSHPYVFEDVTENTYNITDPMFISCWSYTTDEKNAYAWWNLYGKKNNSFRTIIPLRDFIESILSILENENVSEIYIGSLSYTKEDTKTNNNVWDFFKKRKDFEFEDELRIIVIAKDVTEEKAIKDGRYIVRYPFSLYNTSMYKKIDLDQKELCFSPYDTSILEKDKNAKIEVLRNEIRRIR